MINDKEENENFDKSFYLFIDNILKIDFIKCKEISINEDIFPLYFKYTNNIINSYIAEKNNTIYRKIILSKNKTLRYWNYINKSFKNKKFEIKYKIFKQTKQKIIIRFFIVFIFNLLNNVLIIKKKDITNKQINPIITIYQLMNEILNIIGKLYIDKNINDEYFEFILKLLLIFSLVNSLENIEFKPNTIYEIKNLIFFKGCINLIKNVFNNLLEIQKELTEEQENIINNIIIFIKEFIIDSFENTCRNNYINKIFLCKNEYKTLHLIDLVTIISKTNSQKNQIIKNFVELLTNIYNFSFGYENLMSPMLRLLEPFFINNSKKTSKEIKREINISDFPLLLLDSLIKNENKILKDNTCFMKQGFYFGNDTRGLACDFQSLDNEFIIVFGLRIDTLEINEATLFTIKSYKDNSTQIKFFIRKAVINDNYYYELIAGDKRDIPINTDIRIKCNINYILSFNFKIGGLMHSSYIKVNYAKDADLNNEKNKNMINNGRELKIKNFKLENVSIYFGLESNPNKPNSKNNNKFIGFIGDILLFNMKYIKNSSISNCIDEFNRAILSLNGNYFDIISILEDNNEKNIFINHNNKYLNELKNKFKSFGESENKLYDSIKMMISSNSFKLVDYQDEIDYLNLKKYIDNNQIYIKKKYLNIKPDLQENEKKIRLLSSFFDKNFHTFKNELTLEQFIKYEGIDYLSLLNEYNYQIINHITSNMNLYTQNEIDEICQEINLKIKNNLDFFYKQIIRNKLFSKYNSINKYFYQLDITILKLIEIGSLKFEILKCLINILNTLDFTKEISDENEIMKIKIFDFLLNPKLYPKNDQKQLEKLNFIFQNLTALTEHSINKTELMENIDTIEIINKLLSFLWLIEIKNNNNNNDIIQEEKKQNKKLLENTIFYYKSLFLKYIKYFSKYKTFNSKSLNNEFIQVSKKTLEEGQDDEMFLINYLFDKSLEYWNKSAHIFSFLLSVISKTDLMFRFGDSRLSKIKSIIIKEIKNQDDKNKKNLLFISCLKFLIIYYFFDVKSSKKKSKKSNKEQYFHSFLRSIDLTWIFLNSLFSILKKIQFINNIKEENEEEPIIDNIKEEIKEDNIKENINIGEADVKEENFKDLPELENDFKNLIGKEIYIIKSIFEDMVFLLYKMELKKKDLKSNESSNPNDNNEDNKNIQKLLYDTLNKNIDKISKFTGTQIYEEIFSSKSEICAEIFYLKWRLGLNDGGDTYAENAIMKYHKDLLKNNNNPFIFKFYSFISNNKIFQFEMNKENIEKANQTKLNLLNFIVNVLNDCQQEIPIKKENNMSYINNLLNLTILLNEELYNPSTLFQNNLFFKMFHNYISLLDKSCILYSNYYIEEDKNCGKIISEIVYDIFFAISKFNFIEQDFIKIFYKENEKEKEIYTIFYLIDIFKEKILDKEKKINQELREFIPNIDNLKIIHKYCFAKIKKSKIKLFLDKNLYQINDVNFSIYFLAKSFIYLKKKEINEKFKKLLLENFLPLLSRNIFRLYTKRSNFYGNKICHTFPLYSQTKKFIETYLIPNPNKFEIYDEFFFTDMPVNIKEEYDISYCYSSRLLHEHSNSMDILPDDEDRLINNDIIDDKDFEENSDMTSIDNISYNQEKISNFVGRHSTTYNSPFMQNQGKDNKVNNIRFYNTSLDEIEVNNSVDSEDEEREYSNIFELIIKNNIIYNPKNYFFKNIFAEIFKNLIFNDNTFKLIRSAYLSKYRSTNINIDSKQLNYPTRQKNFSNSLEPKIFIKRDYNYYKEEFMQISHTYVNFGLIQKNLQKFEFYKHNYSKIVPKKNSNFLYCELVVPEQYIYFGKMYFLEKYLYFESEENNISDTENIEYFMNFYFSNLDENYKTLKEKSFLIYNEDINEIIQRRTVYLNQSIEIFLKNGKSYFLNFFKKEKVQKAYNYFNDINNRLIKNKLTPFRFNTNNNEEDIKSLSLLFRKGKISNYEYLLKLNKYATRTYNDISQYPVFPWLVKSYEQIPELFKLLENKEVSPEIEGYYFRNMKYSMMVQTDENKKNFETTFLEGKGNIQESLEDEEFLKKFHSHFYNHYSTSAYIIYYLMRMNPYEENLIRLQTGQFDSPSRMFNSFGETEQILKVNSDNREIIPDFFSYFDYFCNLNCCFFGKKVKDNMIVDDLNVTKFYSSKYTNIISSFVNALFNNKKLINNSYISKILGQWVDNIFGKNQLPEKIEDRFETYNIFSKTSYEQATNIEKKFEKLYKKYKEGKINISQFKVKAHDKIATIMEFGMNPRQILTEAVVYEGKPRSFEPFFKSFKSKTDANYYYFNRLNNENFILIKDDIKNKNKTRFAQIFNNKNFKEKESIIYDCRAMNLYKIKTKNEQEIPFFNLNNAFIYLSLQFEKSKIPVFISCRYLDNYFKIQSNNLILNIYYEDLVTCLKSYSENSYNFCTGLLNGKLTKWRITPYLDNSDNNKKNKVFYNFQVREIRYVYAHKSSITAIEIYLDQKIIITTGEDKFIYIRKIYDFELLTSIDLTYCFGNPIISQIKNIFPYLIKVSDLNLLYVLFYDYDSKNTFIRGYNLNGLYFSQAESNKFYNNISFTKYSNLIVGYYNSDNIEILSASSLIKLWEKKIQNDDPKPEIKGTQFLEYNYNYGEFYILYKNEFITMFLKDKDEIKEFETF